MNFACITSPTLRFSFGLVSISQEARDYFGVSISSLHNHKDCLKILSVGLKILGGRER
jgi:hypothetical protein